MSPERQLSFGRSAAQFNKTCKWPGDDNLLPPIHEQALCVL
jgi:hypothetical protein